MSGLFPFQITPPLGSNSSSVHVRSTNSNNYNHADEDYTDSTPNGDGNTLSVEIVKGKYEK